jgi:DNA-binding IclR family transcriptional regulator
MPTCSGGLELRERAKSAGRALDILAAISLSPQGSTFVELVETLRLPKSSLYEVIEVLVDRRYIELDEETRHYRLAIRAWEIASRYLGQHELASEAKPFMRAVVATLNETVQLAILDELDNIYLAKVDCSHPVRLQSEVGKRLAAHATGLGKMLLASLPPDELQERLVGQDLRRFTTRTITDHERLRAELDDARAAGFALDNEEYTPGLRCVAVPIFDHNGQVIAALSASIPNLRAHLNPMWRVLMNVATASLRISERIGAPAEDPRVKLLASRAHATKATARLLPTASGRDSDDAPSSVIPVVPG